MAVVRGLHPTTHDNRALPALSHVAAAREEGRGARGGVGGMSGWDHEQRRGVGSGPPVVRPEAVVRGRGDRVEALAEARARQLSEGSGAGSKRVATAERSGGPVGN